MTKTDLVSIRKKLLHDMTACTVKKIVDYRKYSIVLFLSLNEIEWCCICFCYLFLVSLPLLLQMNIYSQCENSTKINRAKKPKYIGQQNRGLVGIPESVFLSLSVTEWENIDFFHINGKQEKADSWQTFPQLNLTW